MTIIPIYEDNHLLVLNKPAGLLTQPSGTDQNSLEQEAKSWLKVKYSKPGNVFLEAVHRLDKPVSGVVVFGKTSKAVSRLNASIRSKQARKIYYALVEGALKCPEGVLEHDLVHDEYRAQVVPQGKGKLARLSYRVLEVGSIGTLVEIVLETGRYHQIRAQFSAIGCPIVGDSKYGSKAGWPDGGIALHHGRLEIAHPVTGDWLIFEAPLPPNLNVR